MVQISVSDITVEVFFYLVPNLRSFHIVQVYWDELHFQRTTSFSPYVKRFYSSYKIKWRQDETVSELECNHVIILFTIVSLNNWTGEI